MEDQQATHRAKTNTLTLAVWLFMIVGALTQIIGWMAPAAFPKAVTLAYVLLMAAFWLQQLEISSLRRVIEAGRAPAEVHDQKPKS